MKSIPEILAEEFGQKLHYIENVITLIDADNTIPFIARYRKEMHGSMDDQMLRKIADRLNYLRNLDRRRTEILSAVEEQGKLTEEITDAVQSAQTLAELEDIYRPFKQKRRTRATVARARGLEPLSEIVLGQALKNGDINEVAKRYVNIDKGVSTPNDALAGARDIIAETISDDAEIRRLLKDLILKRGILTSKAATKEDSVYRMYYDYGEPVNRIQNHRILAINRGEKEKYLKVAVVVDGDEAVRIIWRRYVRPGSVTTPQVESAAADAYTRLIFPAVEREIRNMLTDRASEQAIRTFGLNLRPLLMQPPVRGRVTMGFDPAYRTGCKIAVVDAFGKVLDTGVVYPTPPHNKKAEAKEKLLRMIQTYGVTAIAIGNGTASKESEIFVAEMLRETEGVAYMMVSEAGASVYSASKLGAEEFPDFDVSLRSAVSIARRLQDPLAELVKIDPKSIGVGQYQHDMPQNRLAEALDGVVEDCVNAVGADVNTASAALLTRIAGLSSTTAKNIVAYREENGAFRSRKEVSKVPKIGPKTYEQCAGFLRVPESENILDHTGVHPESYGAAEKILEICGYTLADVANGDVAGLANRITQMTVEKVAIYSGVGVPTVQDIVRELLKPDRDPRNALPAPMLRTDIMDMSDLKPGMEIRGTVRNVVDFGVFVDIGVHQDGLVHISEVCDRFIRHPSEIVQVGDIVNTVVLNVDPQKKRISLSMKQCSQ
jgi:uncharacterized protein